MMSDKARKCAWQSKMMRIFKLQEMLMISNIDKKKSRKNNHNNQKNRQQR